MMDNRKRQRLDVPRAGAPSLIALNGSTNDISSAATLLAAGQNTFFLDNGNELSPLSGDVFLTICDENLSEDESQEFFTIDSETLAAHIKQEQEIGTQTISSLPQIRIVNAHPQQQTAAATQSSHPPEHPSHRSALNSPTSSSPSTTTTIQLTGNNSSLLPPSMQLPSGCEIYLVKEYIQSGGSSSSASNLTVTSTTGTTGANSTAKIELIEPSKNIKIETNKISEIIDKDSSTSSSSSSSHQTLITSNNHHYVLNGKTKATSAGQANTTNKVHQNQQHNVLLDAYKKRDDKRRATHNEVERRRRDKINSWIFKLKEMLPTDFSNNNSSNTNNNNSFNNNNDNLKINLALAASATIPNSSSSSTPVLPTLQNSFPNGTVRPPPNDSKSQILIKACDYIKSMQEELKCLRECMAENEDLRIKNEQLENELQQLRNERNLNNLQNGNSSSFNLTLSSLNNDNSIFGNTSTVSVGGLNSNGAQIASNSSSPITTFTKRELIIRDFVD